MGQKCLITKYYISSVVRQNFGLSECNRVKYREYDVGVF